MIGYAMCGSFCTLGRSLAGLQRLVDAGEDVLPILSERVGSIDTRFIRAAELRRRVTEITGRRPIDTVVDAEPLGPKTPLDALIVSPCTGNTLAKAAAGITDGAVTMAMKAHLRADRPLLIALATNDALSANLANIGVMLARKNVFFVPLRQDDPEKKPHSCVADFARLPEALSAMRRGIQLRPLFLS